MRFCVTAVRLLKNKHQYRAKYLSAAYFRSGSGRGSGSGSGLHGRILAVFLPQKFCQTSISTDKHPGMASSVEDCAWPNETWSKESVELFNELNKLTEEGKGWTKLLLSYRSDGSRHFLRAVEEKGKFFEYATFFNPSLHCVKGVVQFGLYTRGPIGHVHGGAIATIFDSVMGNCAFSCGFCVLTANLNIDFIRAIPVCSTALAETTVDKVEGKKVFISAALKTVDGNVTYANCTGLFIMINKPGL